MKKIYALAFTLFIALTSVAQTTYSVSYLIVGGGGGGGDFGGGGAGGMLTGTSTNISVSTYSIVVGSGGAAAGLGTLNFGTTR